jgi:hypothetical protein
VIRIELKKMLDESDSRQSGSKTLILISIKTTARHQFSTWKADDADEPVGVLCYGHNDNRHNLVEQVHLLGPLA